MLVGGADGGDRRGAHDGRSRPLAVHPLAQALGPELPIPLGELAQPVGVRHEHVDASAEVGVGGPVQRGVQRGRIAAAGRRRRRAPSPAARRRAAPRCRCRPAPPAAGPPGESTLKRPPTSGGTSSVGDRRRARRARGARPAPGSVVNTRWRERRVAQRVLQPRADDQVLRHRLRGAAGLADHVDQHPPRIDPRAAPRRPSSGPRSPAR